MVDSLYRSINYWDDRVETNGLQNPYPGPQIYVRGQPEYMWGEGDGRFIYPPPDYTDRKEKITGPTPSIRYELIREGIEDCKYFLLLKSLLELAKTIGISDKIIEDAKGFLRFPKRSFFKCFNNPTISAHRAIVPKRIVFLDIQYPTF